MTVTALYGDAGKHHLRHSAAGGHLLHRREEGSVSQSEEPAVIGQRQRMSLAETVLALEAACIEDPVMCFIAKQRDEVATHSHQLVVVQDTQRLYDIV